MLTKFNFLHNLWSEIFPKGIEKMDQNELQQALWAAAKKGDKAKIRMLVVAGADVNMMDADGRTALHIASQNGQADAYKTLLAAREMQEMMKAGLTPSSSTNTNKDRAA